MTTETKNRHATITGNEKLIDLQPNIQQPLLRQLGALTAGTIEKLLAVRQVNDIYTNLLNAPGGKAPFNKILRLLEVTYSTGSKDLDRISRQGPLVVVANHPFGGLEGIILGDLIQQIRPDVKILGNYLLRRIAPIGDMIVPVDPFERKSMVRANAKSYRSCLRWLKDGHCLIIFPAGEVSHYRHRHHRITDPPWSPHVAALVRLSGARVVPIFFPGRNSLLFNLMGLVHPRLRTLMLARELISKKRSHFNL